MNTTLTILNLASFVFILWSIYRARILFKKLFILSFKRGYYRGILAERNRTMKIFKEEAEKILKERNIKKKK